MCDDIAGFDVDNVPKTEADHFMKCPGCGERFDMRDLGQILVHVHDAEIEISEGPEPPPRSGPVQ
jgi:uncharacterized C2H2 Zn-finger protein